MRLEMVPYRSFDGVGLIAIPFVPVVAALARPM